MHLNEFPFVREPWLNYDRVLHEIVLNPTNEEVRDVTMALFIWYRFWCRFRLLFLWPTEIVFKSGIYITRTTIAANMLMKLREKLCFIKWLNFLLFVPFNFLCLFNLCFDLLFKLSLSLRKAHTESLSQSLNALIDLSSACSITLSHLHECLSVHHVCLDVCIIKLDRLHTVLILQVEFSLHFVALRTIEVEYWVWVVYALNTRDMVKDTTLTMALVYYSIAWSYCLAAKKAFPYSLYYTESSFVWGFSWPAGGMPDLKKGHCAIKIN